MLIDYYWLFGVCV